MASSMAEKLGEEPGVRPLCEVILIAGFLGAGKTTLLRHILEWPGDLSKTALLVNEFGRVGIDGELLQGKTPMVELINGCICCSLQGDMLKAIEEILDGFHPERLLIEATGVADPFDILRFLRPSNVSSRLSAPKVVTVLDADLWEGREYFGPLFYNQIKAAALLLFNKIDLLPEDQVPKYLSDIREINADCSIIPTYHCQVDPAVLWTPVIEHLQGSAIHLSPFHEHGSADELGYVAFAFEEQCPFMDECFRRFIEELPMKLYRVKGFVQLNGKRFFLNHVGGKTEWTELDQPGPTKLAFVGWKVDEEEVLNQLKFCLRNN
ncbi:MAG: GTP-binding protein [Deltaproteobacteria bacterium]|nr:GTP-binding protein [Deltaproteobacteria bacterium]